MTDKGIDSMAKIDGSAPKTICAFLVDDSRIVALIAPPDGQGSPSDVEVILARIRSHCEKDNANGFITMPRQRLGRIVLNACKLADERDEALSLESPARVPPQAGDE